VGDRLFERLVHIARDALTRHLAEPKPMASAVTAYGEHDPIGGASAQTKGPDMAA
jgi:hypothetical protein